MEEHSSLLNHKATIKWGRSAFTALRSSSINGIFALTRDGWTLRVLPGFNHASVNARIPFQQIYHADWSHVDGNLLAVSTDDGVEILEPRKLRKLASFPRGTRFATRVRWSPQDHYLAVAARTVIVYDTASELEIARFPSHPAGITEMCWSDEGIRIASVDERGNLRIHDLQKQVSHQIRNTGTTIPVGLGWSPGDKFLAVQEASKRGSRWHVQILDGHTFKESAQLDHHSVWCLKFSTNGKFLATKSHKGVKLWRTSSWTLAGQFDEPTDNFVWQELEFEYHHDRLITLGDLGKDLRVWEYSREIDNTTEVIAAQANDSARVLDASTDAELKPVQERSKLRFWRKMFDAVESAKESHSKGEALQQLCEKLFSSVPSFQIESKQRTKDEEIDIVIFNQQNLPPLMSEGPLVLVECKNWSTKCGKNEFVIFRSKMENRYERCTVGFMVSWNGFTSTVEIAQLRNSQGKQIVVCLSKEHLLEAVESGDFSSIIIREYRKSLLT